MNGKKRGVKEAGIRHPHRRNRQGHLRRDPGEHKEFKGLETGQRRNLRDHMTDLELIFTMLGEAATTEIAKRKDAQGFPTTATPPRQAAPSPAMPARNWKPRGANQSSAKRTIRQRPATLRR